jgi:regulator of cell morphogenesis and NO signaling
MSITSESTIRELAIENPAATRVFEKLGIDYCCGGSQTLEQACRTARAPLEQVIDSLEGAAREGQARENTRDWKDEPLADLIAHIKDTHHKYTRDEIARLGPLCDKVCAAHGQKHPELIRMHTVFAGLAAELSAHLMKEEIILFPYIVRLEEAAMEKERVVPPAFGTVRNPVAMMMHEHDGAGDALREMRRASGDYAAPAGACTSFQTLYRSLAALETDLHRHIHLENNILFPRAIAMETAQSA